MAENAQNQNIRIRLEFRIPEEKRRRSRRVSGLLRTKDRQTEKQSQERKHRKSLLMNKTELVAAMAEQTNLSKKDVEAALKAFVDVVAEELKKGEKVQLVGFGTFEVSERAAREGRNPQTGETMQIKASKTPKFKAGKALKDMMN